MPKQDPFHVRQTLTVGTEKATYYSLTALEEAGVVKLDELPYSIRILLENALRNCDGFEVMEQDIRHIAEWTPTGKRMEIPFKPARVILQDFTGVPCVVDLAAMRDAMKRMGGDVKKINPLVPVDLVIDHSVQTDCFGCETAFSKNLELEFHRNGERYALLRWAKNALSNFRVVPPSMGIIHQVNLEYLAKGVFLKDDAELGGKVAFPDTLVGTDSHTVMINGLGVLGWGVGGIEAEAVMLGQPLYMLLPDVIGVELTGELREGVTATDLVLTMTALLRKEGVVGKFVEYFGPGAASMKLADRATMANMGPEYGATMGFFPVDEQTLNFLRQTGRSANDVAWVEAYTRQQKLFRTVDAPTPKYTKVLHFDLSTVVPCLAGPKRPQDNIPLNQMKQAWNQTFAALPSESNEKLGHGSVVIAAITSCTNTSNPSVMLAAGLLAKKAVAQGLRSKPWVKTSLGPGSRVVTDYLNAAGLTEALDQLGFQTVGYGCLTCIGNSGTLINEVAREVTEKDLTVAAVVSGNRNFEGRVNPLVKANYLASPPLVVAYALAGSVNFDFETEPLGTNPEGKPVFLRDIFPTNEEIAEAVQTAVQPEMFARRYANVFADDAAQSSDEGVQRWNAVSAGSSDLFPWNRQSTYVQEPPFMLGMENEKDALATTFTLDGARALLLLGDSITTDHISPAGAIKPDSPAGKFLREQGVSPSEFNSYGSRRGNDRVMVRGTFANIRLRNQLAPGTEGGVTRHLPDGETMSVFEAAEKYRAENVPLVVLAGAEYGTGSSRDWAAKGVCLLGVRAVIAESYERIHRSNLVGMGILPLQFLPGDSWKSLGLDGTEPFSLSVDLNSFQPNDRVTVTVNGERTFETIARIDTPVEIEYFRNGGILQTVLRRLA